jgi:hypothetical protein
MQSVPYSRSMPALEFMYTLDCLVLGCVLVLDRMPINRPRSEPPRETFENLILILLGSRNIRCQ